MNNNAWVIQNCKFATALYKEATIRKEAEVLCDMLKTAKIERISIENMDRLVRAICKYSAMDEATKDVIDKALFQALTPYAKQGQLSLADVRLIWPRMVARLEEEAARRRMKVRIPPIESPDIQLLIKDVLNSLHGAYGRVETPETREIDELSRQYIRQKSPATSPQKPRL